MLATSFSCSRLLIGALFVGFDSQIKMFDLACAKFTAGLRFLESKSESEVGTPIIPRSAQGLLFYFL
ncbi:hypothetical protein KJ903_01370 [Patescibacteria group bacterium]|nr:hypothetical protein [Patescibacteria group bacterium]